MFGTSGTRDVLAIGGEPRNPLKEKSCFLSSTGKIGGRPAGCHRAPSDLRQPAYKPGSGWRASTARTRDGHSSWMPVARHLQQPTRTARSGHGPEALRACARKLRAAPIRSCSRWGLPCRRRCRRRGALLPHRFTLTAVKHATHRGGLFSVALSLGSRPPDVIRHRLSTEPGLSSPACAGVAVRPTDGKRDGETARCRQEAARRSKARARAAMFRGRPRWASRSCKVFCVEASAIPSIRCGRKWRWKANTTSRVAGSYTPLLGIP
jgi:hypothetical protein